MRMAAAALAVAALGAGALGWPSLSPRVAAPDLIVVPAGPWDYRPSGDWRRDGLEVDPPMVRAVATAPLRITRHQVSRGEYGACVAAGACLPAGSGPEGLPQTGVSWHDATAFALWLSDARGEAWRLPTDAEWQRAAAERFVDDAVGEVGGDPSARWLAVYAFEAGGRGEADPILRPAGAFGANSLGVEDLAGNVWEWTDECVGTGVLGPGGEVLRRDEYCGARVVEGKHRAVVVDFVRDARAGGCGAGVPPDFLGFRLVRDG